MINTDVTIRKFLNEKIYYANKKHFQSRKESFDFVKKIIYNYYFNHNEGETISLQVDDKKIIYLILTLKEPQEEIDCFVPATGCIPKIKIRKIVKKAKNKKKEKEINEKI